MGWTVLYVGFGFVALWLLGEVLLQYKARLRWRMLAFTGFLGVVAGVLLHSVPVIVAGALAFAVGQTYVTLSFRRGFSTGWAIGGSPGASRRRKGTTEGAAREPALEVTDLEYVSGAPDEEPPPGAGAGHGESGFDTTGSQQGDYEEPAYSQGGYEPTGFDTAGFDATGFDATGFVPNGYDPNAYDRPAYEPAGAMASDSTAVYAPQPMPDDTGQYGIYSDTAYGTAAQYGTYDATGYDQNQQQNTGQYDYGSGQQQYAPYSDPYVGSGQYDASYGGQQQYADPYAGQYTTDTPPGGVWVPQQRETEQPPYGTPEQPAYEPQPNGGAHGYDNGYSEQQYRY
ncbi:hypothetical protein AB0436_01435 [Streptomyces sp. NPDC051322]|uniref:hypothetical protein n=1 Tax=Streptomyces sp. NPDC051322 TaxID=3154645 RepID=UPI00344CFBA4